MLDRVAERRRAAQLARHYRDEEGLSIAEIARRLGRAEGDREGLSVVRREALCCIPGAAGTNSKEGSWV